MYHPYKNPYNVLPNLIKVPTEPLFEPDDQLDRYIDAKQDISHRPYHTCNIDGRDLRYICKFINSRCLEDYPNYTSALDLCDIGIQIQEDLVIQKIESAKDWMAACHVCIPTGWKPEEEIGKSFAELHSNIPGFSKNPNGVKAMLKGPFHRFLWTIRFDDTLAGYPGTYNTTFIDENHIWVRVEKQIIYPIPEVKASLFALKIYIVKPDLEALKNTVKNMTETQRQYKFNEEFLKWVYEE